MVNGGTPSLVDRGEKVVYTFSPLFLSLEGIVLHLRSCIAFIYFIVLYFALITTEYVVVL